jgi:hypothetical protein
VHVLAGLGAGLFGTSAPLALGAAAAYEVVEYAHEWPRGSVLFGSKRPESLINVVTDLAAFGIAHWFGQKRPNTVAALLAIGAAGVLAYWLMPPRST